MASQVRSGQDGQRGAVTSALDQMLARTARRLSLARVGVAACFLLVAAAVRLAGARPEWLGAASTVALYGGAAGLLLLLQRSGSFLALASAALPILDVVCVYSLELRGVPGAPEWSLGVFVFLVLLSAFALRPLIVWATALLAWICQGNLLLGVQREGASVWPSGGLLVLVAAVTAWAIARVQEGLSRLEAEEVQGQQANALSEELVARLVHEEVQSRLANERSEELSRANNHIAQVNAILKDQHRKLQLAQREAEKLTALLVHDMKGPLSSVLGFVELVAMQLGAKPDAQGQVKHLRTALSQGRRLLDMIADLLAIARLERGAVSARREETDVLALLQAVVNGQAPRAQALGVLLGAVGEPGLRAAFDKDLMQRVLENLVSNALTYVKEGDRVELAAAVEAGELVLAVRNSGPAIPDAIRGSLFQRFVTSALPGRGNVGLGLYFCRLVAEAHQGTIQLEDWPGWSVSFVVRVPAGLQALEAAGSAHPPVRLALVTAPALTPVATPKAASDRKN